MLYKTKVNTAHRGFCMLSAPTALPRVGYDGLLAAANVASVTRNTSRTYVRIIGDPPTTLDR